MPVGVVNMQAEYVVDNLEDVHSGENWKRSKELAAWQRAVPAAERAPLPGQLHTTPGGSRKGQWGAPPTAGGAEQAWPPLHGWGADWYESPIGPIGVAAASGGPM